MGFQVATPWATKRVVLGAVKLSGAHYGRKVLGRALLKVLPDKSMDSISEAVRQWVAPGSLVWTDGAPSYNFLDSDEHYTHDKVVHRKGEFSKRRADGVKVSTNAVEGLFSRCKRFLRGFRACPAKRSRYGLFLSEFLFRNQFLGKGWRQSAELFRVLRVQNKPERAATSFHWEDFEETYTWLSNKCLESRTMAADGGLSYKETNQGMFWFKFCWYSRKCRLK